MISLSNSLKRTIEHNTSSVFGNYNEVQRLVTMDNIIRFITYGGFQEVVHSWNAFINLRDVYNIREGSDLILLDTSFRTIKRFPYSDVFGGDNQEHKDWLASLSTGSIIYLRFDTQEVVPELVQILLSNVVNMLARRSLINNWLGLIDWKKGTDREMFLSYPGSNIFRIHYLPKPFSVLTTPEDILSDPLTESYAITFTNVVKLFSVPSGYYLLTVKKDISTPSLPEDPLSDYHLLQITNFVGTGRFNYIFNNNINYITDFEVFDPLFNPIELSINTGSNSNKVILYGDLRIHN